MRGRERGGRREGMRRLVARGPKKKKKFNNVSAPAVPALVRLLPIVNARLLTQVSARAERPPLFFSFFFFFAEPLFPDQNTHVAMAGKRC